MPSLEARLYALLSHDGSGVLLDKAPANEADDPFATFTEWSNEADEKACGGL